MATAAANAVLDVVETENLASNAQEVGAYLVESLAAIDDGRIADVRGPGLFVGIELENEPLAHAVVNNMRSRGVLIGSTGADDNVLKIRPPLVCRPHHADIIAIEGESYRRREAEQSAKTRKTARGRVKQSGPKKRGSS